MKTRLYLIVIFLVLLIVGIGAALFLQYSVQYGTIAEISVDGNVIETIDLNTVTVPYTVQVGEGNTVLVEQGAISMHSANCPDRLCVKQGKITGGVYPIVCLPNRVTVKIISKTAEEPDVVIGGAPS